MAKLSRLTAAPLDVSNGRGVLYRTAPMSHYALPGASTSMDSCGHTGGGTTQSHTGSAPTERRRQQGISDILEADHA